MKNSPRFLLCIVALLQLSIAAFLMLYSFAVGSGKERDVADFAQYEAAWQKMDRPKVDDTIQPERIARMAHDIITMDLHFSNTVLIGSIVMFGLGCTSFIALLILPKMPNKALQATAAVLLISTVVGGHNAVVADASALPAAVPELGR